MADRVVPKPLAPVPLGRKDLYKHFKGIYETFMRKASSDLPAALDFPGIGPVGMGVGILGMTKRAGKIAMKLPKIRKWEDLSEALRSSFEFGAKHAKEGDVLEEAFKAGAKSKERLKRIRALPKTARTGEAAMTEAYRGQFYREVLEGADEALGKPRRDWQKLWSESLGMVK